MTHHVLTFDAVPLVDSRLFRQALGRFATGVTVVTTRAPDEPDEPDGPDGPSGPDTQGGGVVGMTANSFSAVSLDPPLILWSIRSEAPSLPAFLRSGVFAVNVLTQEQADLSHRFATPRDDKFAGIAWSRGHGGCPRLEGALALFECDLQQAIPAGDHQILLGRVVRASFDDAASPLLFSSGRYAVAARLPNMDASSDLAAMWEGLG